MSPSPASKLTARPSVALADDVLFAIVPYLCDATTDPKKLLATRYPYKIREMESTARWRAASNGEDWTMGMDPAGYHDSSEQTPRRYHQGIPVLAALCRVSKYFHRLFMPRLYHYVCAPCPRTDLDWVQRLIDSLLLPGSEERFVHTRILDYGVSGFGSGGPVRTPIVGTTMLSKMPNLQFLRGSVRAAITFDADSMGASTHSLRGLVIANPHDFVRNWRGVKELDWAIIEGCSDPAPRLEDRSNKVCIRDVTFDGGFPHSPRAILDLVNLSKLRRLELQLSWAGDLHMVFDDLPALPSLEKLELYLHSGYIDLEMVVGPKLPVCRDLKLVRSDRGSPWADQIYLTLPSQIKSFCPDPHAILRRDAALRDGLERQAGLVKIIVPCRPSQHCGTATSDMQYTEAVRWLKQECGRSRVFSDQAGFRGENQDAVGLR